MLKKVGLLVLYIVIFFVFWNIFDYLLATFITHSQFEFTAIGDAFVPTVVAVVTGYAVIFRKK